MKGAGDLSGAGTERGLASWYGADFAGLPTASGEVFDPARISAAHRALPLGTVVDVTNEKNGRTVRVRINDRGPFIAGRIVDLSKAAAAEIGSVADGVVPVTLTVVTLGSGRRATAPRRGTVGRVRRDLLGRPGGRLLDPGERGTAEGTARRALSEGSGWSRSTG